MSHFRKILTSRPIAFFGVRRSRSFKDLTITPERNEMERFFRCRLVIYGLGYQGSKVRTLMIQKTIFWPFQLNELTWRGGAGVTLTIDSRPASSVEDQGHRKFKHIFPWGTDQECFHCHHFRTNDHNNIAGTDVHVWTIRWHQHGLFFFIFSHQRNLTSKLHLKYTKQTLIPQFGRKLKYELTEQKWPWKVNIYFLVTYTVKNSVPSVDVYTHWVHSSHFFLCVVDWIMLQRAVQHLDRPKCDICHQSLVIYIEKPVDTSMVLIFLQTN